jgi:hypothetical protein
MKAAVASLTRSLALELGGRRIRVNCIAPDPIPAPGIGPVRVNTPLPVDGPVEDVAGAALSLASDRSRFATGTTLQVDAGGYASGGGTGRQGGGFEPCGRGEPIPADSSGSVAKSRIPCRRLARPRERSGRSL